MEIGILSPDFLSQGDEIEWPRPGGGMLRVRIKEVIYQPERSGEHHR